MEPEWFETEACDLEPIEIFTGILSATLTGQGGLAFTSAVDAGEVAFSSDPDAVSLPEHLVDFLNELGKSSATEGLEWPTPQLLSQLRAINKIEAPFESLATEEGWGFRHILVLRSDYFETLMNPAGFPTVDDYLCDATPQDFNDALGHFLHEMVHVLRNRAMGDQAFFAQAVLVPGQTTLHYYVTEFVNTIEQRAFSTDYCADDPTGIAGLALTDSSGNYMDSAPIETVGMFARSYLQLNDRARVRAQRHDLCQEAEGRGVFSCYSAAGSGGSIYVGISAEAAELFATEVLDLRDRSALSGSAFAGSVVTGNDVSVGGLTLDDAGTISDVIEAHEPRFPRFVQTVAYLPPGTVWSIPPGAYEELQVSSGTVVYFESGAYYFARLGIESGGAISVVSEDGPSRIFVANEMVFHGDIDGDPALTLLSYEGTGRLSVEGMMNGTVIAPRATIDVQSRNVWVNEVSHRGALFGNRIEVHQNTNFYHDPFPHLWLPEGEDATCADGLVNQDETDIDCGGSCGATCSEGSYCSSGSDCTLGMCGGGVCVSDPSQLDCPGGGPAFVSAGMGVAATLSGNGCLVVPPAAYPNWWGTRQMRVQSGSGSVYPLPFSWSNSCAGAGQGVISGSWQSIPLGTTNSSCSTIVSFSGSPNAATTLYWYP